MLGIRIRSIATLLTFCIALATISPALAQTPVASPVVSEPTFEEAACVYDLPSGVVEGVDAVCGWVTAPMFPDGSGEGVVQLPIVHIFAVSDNPAPDPLLILLGGPGQSMGGVLPLFGNDAPMWRYMLDRQDVILFDQRGMGKSQPSLACPFEQGDGEGAAAGFALLRCGSELVAQGINPTAFTTKANAADIEAIRIAMGFEQISLYGISYGSKLVLSFIRDYPDSVRASIIASPLPLEQNPFADQTTGFNNALSLVWDACAADPACAAANPDPEGAMLKAIERLAAEPMIITAMDPVTGTAIDIPVDHFQFMQTVYLSVFVGPMIPALPYLVTSVAEGDDTFLQMTGELLVGDWGVSLGAMFTYFCQDEVPFAPVADTRAILGESPLSQPIADGTWISLGDQTYTICTMWKYPTADPAENQAVVSDEPLLILTGTFDPITPAINGERIANNFPNSQVVKFAAQGHDPASFVPECSGPIILGFLNAPDLTVDETCAAVPADFSYPSPNATPVATPIPTT